MSESARRFLGFRSPDSQIARSWAYPLPMAPTPSQTVPDWRGLARRRRFSAQRRLRAISAITAIGVEGVCLSGHGDAGDLPPPPCLNEESKGFNRGRPRASQTGVYLSRSDPG